MKTTHKSMIAGVLTAAALTSCASNGAKPAPPAAAKPNVTAAAPPAPAGFATFPPVTYKSGAATLDVAVRGIGNQAGGGLVTIQGIDVRAVPPLAFERTPYEEAIKQLAQVVQCRALREPYYYFIVPEGYEMLLGTQVAAPFSPRYESVSAPMAFGFNTKVFNVFAGLSQFTNGAIMVDNIIGEQAVGELVLGAAPLRTGIEAVLRSARVAPGAFRVESTEEYIFVRAAGNTSKTSPLLNENALTPALKAMLDRRVSVALPAAQSDAQHVAFADSVSPLSDVLTTLSAQLGVPVDADAAMLELPVNPCILRNVRLRTALDLLVRQWPLSNFGYDAETTRIHLRAV